ncbi:MAG: hypothetical protein V3U82_01525, partial [Robiginitomaculum sp.]
MAPPLLTGKRIIAIAALACLLQACATTGGTGQSPVLTPAPTGAGGGAPVITGPAPPISTPPTSEGSGSGGLGSTNPSPTSGSNGDGGWQVPAEFNALSNWQNHNPAPA